MHINIPLIGTYTTCTYMYRYIIVGIYNCLCMQVKLLLCVEKVKMSRNFNFSSKMVY